MSEDDTLVGRVRRYTRVSSAVGGLAARLAGQRYLGLPIDKGRHAAELRRALGGLKGPLMKVAQIMSTIPQALPREYAEELAQLQSNAPAMGWPFVKRRMVAELGPDWPNRFASFEHEAAAAASLGQVHRASTADAEWLACKLQYPDMASAVEADLNQLKLIFAIYRRYDRGIDPSEVLAEIAERLREELDYERELKHLTLYGAMLADEPVVHVAAPLPDLCTRRLLTMTWLEGRPLLDFKDAAQAVRDGLAERLFRAWYLPFYRYGVIHADPHLGNYSVAADHTINLLDFGCIRVFKPKFVRGVIDLYHALQNDDRDLAVHAYETWGFTGLATEMIDTLNMWARFVYAPLLEDRARRIQEFDSGGIYGIDVAEKVHRGLREHGGVTPPREFVFMDRAAIGLGGVFLHLKAEINWHRLFHELIEGFDETKLRQRQNAALKKAGLPLP
jgi:predicted unusual protein kinase regulating ubiquinone biosynthesis (AarF/ABC1/UbiB family)